MDPSKVVTKKEETILVHSYLMNIYQFWKRKKVRRNLAIKTSAKNLKAQKFQIKKKAYAGPNNDSIFIRDDETQSSTETISTLQNDKTYKKLKQLRYNIHELYTKKKPKSSHKNKLIYKSCRLVESNSQANLSTQNTKRKKKPTEKVQNRLSSMKRMQDNKPKKLLKADQSCIIQQDSKKNLKMSSIQVIKANSTDKRDK